MKWDAIDALLILVGFYGLALLEGFLVGRVHAALFAVALALPVLRRKLFAVAEREVKPNLLARSLGVPLLLILVAGAATSALGLLQLSFILEPAPPGADAFELEMFADRKELAISRLGTLGGSGAALIALGVIVDRLRRQPVAPETVTNKAD